MPSRIEDYALIGDTQTAALVGKDGSIDWLCVPRFDSGAVFAALLGTIDHGRWRLAPAGGIQRVERRYRGETLVLETTFYTDDGVVRVVDCMPIRTRTVDIVRVVECVSGRVPMHMDLRMRFDYGSYMPWVTDQDGRLHATAGPDSMCLTTPAHTEGAGPSTVADFIVGPGDTVPFVLAWHPSHEHPPHSGDALGIVRRTEAWWRHWSSQCTYTGEAADLVRRSLITLKALTYAPTGGIVAAVTTSLPEWIGSVRNWDYRYGWLRDSVLTLFALLSGGYDKEALAWRDWLLRAAAGEPSKLQIMYGLGGERRLDEYSIDWLPGYEGSAPVRVGNAASGQFQLDVYGETLASLALMRAVAPVQAGAAGAPDEAWKLETALLDFLEGAWRHPDDGLWEMRGDRQHFTHSKVMAWLGFASAVQSAKRFDLPGPIDRWRAAATRSTSRCVPRASIPTSARSLRPTGPSSSTPHCSRSRARASCPRPTSAWSAPSPPSSVSCYRTASSSVTAASTPTTGCRPVRARSCRVRSGWSATTCSRVASAMPECCSTS